jgi:hypothetical protein
VGPTANPEAQHAHRANIGGAILRLHHHGSPLTPDHDLMSPSGISLFDDTRQRGSGRRAARGAAAVHGVEGDVCPTGSGAVVDTAQPRGGRSPGWTTEQHGSMAYASERACAKDLRQPDDRRRQRGIGAAIGTGGRAP